MTDIKGESHKFKSGDVIIISSDGWQFRVKSHVLAWASPVFADMIALSTPDSPVRLELTHPFEDKDTVHRFLLLVTEQLFDESPALLSSYFSAWRGKLHALLRFLDKWGSERGVFLLRSIGAAAIMRGELQWESAFVYSAMLNDLAMCHQVILRFGTNVADGEHIAARDDEDLKAIHEAEDGRCFDLGAAPYEFVCALPQAYQYALNRAALEHSLWKEKEVEDFADRFVEVAAAALKAEKRDPEPYALFAGFPNIVSEPVPMNRPW